MSIIMFTVQSFSHKIISQFASQNISNMVRDTMLDTMTVRQETIYGLAIGTTNFDPG